jgi:hypothetical protein
MAICAWLYVGYNRLREGRWLHGALSLLIAVLMIYNRAT